MANACILIHIDARVGAQGLSVNYGIVLVRYRYSTGVLVGTVVLFLARSFEIFCIEE